MGNYNFLNFLKQYKCLNIHLLRNIKLFVKGRYSRNRLWSKVIVYFGLYFNGLLFFWFFFYSYKMIFNLNLIFLFIFFFKIDLKGMWGWFTNVLF